MVEEEIRAFATKNYIPIVRKQTCDLLTQKVKEKNSKNILEIGTAIGYSAIKMLQNSSAKIVTLENDEERKNLALKNFENENLLDRVTLVFGDAIDYLQSTSEKFDFIFLDGPKGQYYKYLPYLIDLLTKNGILFCDNVLYAGLVDSKVEIPKKHRTMVNNLRKFLALCEDLKKNNVTKNELIPLEDGVLILEKL